MPPKPTTPTPAPAPAPAPTPAPAPAPTPAPAPAPQPPAASQTFARASNLHGMALANRFLHHPPTEDQVAKYATIRSACLVLAETIASLAPDSPEKARSLNALDEVMFLANAAIARNP